MKAPFLFLFVSVLLVTLVFVMLTSAVLAELKEFVDRKRRVGP
jgi:hypothetical protein